MGSSKNDVGVEAIFSAFAAIYGHKFISQFPTASSKVLAKKLWEDGLSKLDAESVKRGIDYCLHTSENLFPPSLPEFRSWCMPTEEELGIPDVNQAYKWAIAKQWSHPIIFHAVQMIGSYDFRNMSYEQSFKKFSAIYKKLVKSVIGGEQFLLPDHVRMTND